MAMPHRPPFSHFFNVNNARWPNLTSSTLTHIRGHSGPVLVSFFLPSQIPPRCRSSFSSIEASSVVFILLSDSDAGILSRSSVGRAVPGHSKMHLLKEGITATSRSSKDGFRMPYSRRCVSARTRLTTNCDVEQLQQR